MILMNTQYLNKSIDFEIQRLKMIFWEGTFSLEFWGGAKFHKTNQN